MASSPVTPSLTLIEAIEQRRAARSFKPDPIPTEILKEILRLGTRSPSGFNLQPWRFIVLQEAASKAKLQDCAYGQRQVAEAPVVLICCGDRQAFSPENVEAVIALGQAIDAVPEPFAQFMRDNIPGTPEKAASYTSLETWTNRHVMLAVAHTMIAAKGFGVDSCPMEGFDGPQVQAAFNIPETVDVCCLLPLGYAGDPIKLYGGRFALDRVCYAEGFGEPFNLS